MKAFVCVYRHPTPSKWAWEQTSLAAQTNQHLKKFLDQYHPPNCFLDWGDDPSFYAATEKLGNTGAASWGVCRRVVRKQLDEGDFVIFFCAKENINTPKVWDYYFIGCATVKNKISRLQLWNDSRFEKYRSFYNVLVKIVDGNSVQHETFYSYHNDWRRRVEVAYIIFDPDKTLTKINITKPLHVARRDPPALVERWFSKENESVHGLEELIFTKQKNRTPPSHNPPATFTPTYSNS